MTANPFAALLAGVPRYVLTLDTVAYAEPDNGEWVRLSDALAALAAAAPADMAEAGKVLEGLRGEPTWSGLVSTAKDAADLITTLLARIAAMEAQIKGLEAERDETYAYAKHLAEALFANGKFDAPQWEPLGDTLGVLTQIDNMVAGIRARAETALTAMTQERDELRDMLERSQHVVPDLYTKWHEKAASLLKGSDHE